MSAGTPAGSGGTKSAPQGLWSLPPIQFCSVRTRPAMAPGWPAVSAAWTARIPSTVRRSATLVSSIASCIASMLASTSRVSGPTPPPASPRASARARPRGSAWRPSTLDDAIDSVRSSRRARGSSARLRVALRPAIARSASDTTPAVAAGRPNSSPTSATGSNVS